jgi:hypothetical protein
MSFPRHREIFPSDGGASLAANAPAHRLDEFPAGYSLAGCSPAWPASASPTVYEYAVMSSCRSSSFHRTVNCVLTVCVTPGGKRTLTTRDFPNERHYGTRNLPRWVTRMPDCVRGQPYYSYGRRAHRGACVRTVQHARPHGESRRAGQAELALRSLHRQRSTGLCASTPSF